MNSYVYIAFLVIILSQTNEADRVKSQQRQEKGKKECEYYKAGKYPAGIWEGTWRAKCKLDSHNRTIRAKAIFLYKDDGLYDPCCSDYLGMACHQIYNEKTGNGYCGKPDPYQADWGFGRDDFLSLMKKNKMAEGIQLDDRWRDVD